MRKKILYDLLNNKLILKCNQMEHNLNYKGKNFYI